MSNSLVPEHYHIHIEPSHGWKNINLRELWEYRELLVFLIWRDVIIRYKQTALGAAWAIIQPLLTMVVFSLFFGKLAAVPSDGIPYPLFSFSALVPWTFFSNGLSFSANSLVSNANMLKKVYFPRLILPISTILAGLLDFVLAFIILLVMMVCYGYFPTVNILWLPLFFLLTLITCIGVGLWLSALNVEYRDIRYIVPFLTQIWLFATPIAYSSNMLSEPWKTLYGLNPMAGVIDGFRWALLGIQTPPGPIVFLSAAVSIVLLITGLMYYRRVEKNFSDIV